MIKARQHRPNWVETDADNRSCEVETTEDLLNVEWVKKYMEWEQFHSFCKSSQNLMIENKDGTWWWVVAYIEGELDLEEARMIHE